MVKETLYVVFAVVLFSFATVSFAATLPGNVEGDSEIPSELTFDFNSSAGGWTAGGYADWQWGWPSYEIDGNAWETNIGDNYFNKSSGWLDSPLIRMSSEGADPVADFPHRTWEALRGGGPPSAPPAQKRQ